MTTVLLPTSIALDPALPDGVTTATYDVDVPLPDDLLGADALVAWGNPTPVLADAARRMPGLRWVQALAAGPDQVLAAGFGPDVRITSGRGLHDGPVAEHTLALVLAAARRLPELVRAQDAHRWADELGGRQNLPHEGGEFRSLSGARVLIWGFGSIAARLAPLLTVLGAQVIGVASRAGERAGYPVITPADVPRTLPGTDVLIGILPATPATRKVLDASVFAALPDHAWVVNVGRGATLDESALLEAVRSGGLAGAALDVFETEPLPTTSALWDEPRVLITPHAAGGRPVGADTLLADNIRAFVRDEPLRNLVAR
ncbi:phosphoglycerate dehydrogenase [Cellulomonas triticagri]|uniref:Phosphoglycerate dehydrogenase n=1 Tax=Cellulomonas triticagri TaxID=2483352 RepID=A0A3M2IY81_9CELL|nr:phosphoglycerate dehydrogenase [Cellulomonas triticagri]RMI06822.1 phosphoglycerate dehydrogenase [Cellulomonas triticagri]